MKVTIVAWGSELLQFSGAAREAGIALAAWQVHELKDDPEKRRRCIESCNGSDVVLDAEMRQLFADENLWALEEVGRRLLEAHERGLWDADPDILEGLRVAYLEIEGWIENRMDDVGGDVQGGAVRVVPVENVKTLRRKE